MGVTKIMVFEQIQQDGFEQIVFCHDKSVGLKAIISLHSTVLGPAVGGCRMWDYKNEQEALTDVLRLSKGMTYKASVAGLNWGGGKAVIWGDAKTQKTPQMLARFGEYVDRLSGNYVTAKDVGIGADDLKAIKTKTNHVLGIAGEAHSSGDPSPATSHGVYHGLKAGTKAAFNGDDSLKGKTIAIQGLGSVAYYLLEYLHKEGAKMIGCDVDQASITRATSKYPIEIVSPDKIYDVSCDIFSPNALGAIINKDTIPRIKAKVIAGASNNQLATNEDGDILHKKGVIYTPDYVINGGGLINIYHEGGMRGEYSHKEAFDHVAGIGKTMTQILERSKSTNTPSYLVADHIAEERIEKARKAKS
jgi:leucine dehydrogenase